MQVTPIKYCTNAVYMFKLTILGVPVLGRTSWSGITITTHSPVGRTFTNFLDTFGTPEELGEGWYKAAFYGSQPFADLSSGGYLPAVLHLRFFDVAETGTLDSFDEMIELFPKDSVVQQAVLPSSGTVLLSTRIWIRLTSNGTPVTDVLSSELEGSVIRPDASAPVAFDFTSVAADWTESDLGWYYFEATGPAFASIGDVPASFVMGVSGNLFDPIELNIWINPVITSQPDTTSVIYKVGQKLMFRPMKNGLPIPSVNLADVNIAVASPVIIGSQVGSDVWTSAFIQAGTWCFVDVKHSSVDIWPFNLMSPYLPQMANLRITSISGTQFDPIELNIWLLEESSYPISLPAPLCRCFGRVSGSDSSSYETGYVEAELLGTAYFDGQLITPYKVRTAIRNGEWFLDLYPNSVLAPTTLQYRFTIVAPGVSLSVDKIVPAQSTYQVIF